MATPPGADDVGAAVLQLVRIPAPSAPERSTRQQLAYVTSARTGASNRSITRQLGIKAETLRAWQNGSAKPSAASARKIDTLFGRFWEINNANRFTKAAGTRKTLKLAGTPSGIITVQGRPRSSVLIERGSRNWKPVLAATTDRAAWEAFANEIIGPSPLPPIEPDYLWFYAGTYKITLQ